MGLQKPQDMGSEGRSGVHRSGQRTLTAKMELHGHLLPGQWAVVPDSPSGAAGAKDGLCPGHLLTFSSVFTDTEKHLNQEKTRKPSREVGIKT